MSPPQGCRQDKQRQGAGTGVKWPAPCLIHCLPYPSALSALASASLGMCPPPSCPPMSVHPVFPALPPLTPCQRLILSSPLSAPALAPFQPGAQSTWSLWTWPQPSHTGCCGGSSSGPGCRVGAMAGRGMGGAGTGEQQLHLQTQVGAGVRAGATETTNSHSPCPCTKILILDYSTLILDLSKYISMLKLLKAIFPLSFT